MYHRREYFLPSGMKMSCGGCRPRHCLTTYFFARAHPLSIYVFDGNDELRGGSGGRAAGIVRTCARGYQTTCGGGRKGLDCPRASMGGVLFLLSS